MSIRKYYKDRYGEEINDSEADSQGTKLLKLFKLIYRPIPKNDLKKYMKKKMNVAVVIFKDKNGKILLNHRKDNPPFDEDVWELIGGGINENESPLEAIKREIKEELNYTVNELKDKLKFSRELKISTDKYFSEAHIFIANFPGFDKLSDSDEVAISDLKLFSKSVALKLNLLPISKDVLVAL